MQNTDTKRKTGQNRYIYMYVYLLCSQKLSTTAPFSDPETFCVVVVSLEGRCPTKHSARLCCAHRLHWASRGNFLCASFLERRPYRIMHHNVHCISLRFCYANNIAHDLSVRFWQCNERMASPTNNAIMRKIHILRTIRVGGGWLVRSFVCFDVIFVLSCYKL